VDGIIGKRRVSLRESHSGNFEVPLSVASTVPVERQRNENGGFGGLILQLSNALDVLLMF
jgi:hypothetical protein